MSNCQDESINNLGQKGDKKLLANKSVPPISNTIFHTLY